MCGLIGGEGMRESCVKNYSGSIYFSETQKKEQGFTAKKVLCTLQQFTLNSATSKYCVLLTPFIP